MGPAGEQGVVQRGRPAQVGQEGRVDVEPAVPGRAQDAGRDEEAEGDGYDQVVGQGRRPAGEGVEGVDGEGQGPGYGLQRDLAEDLVAAACRLWGPDEDVYGLDEGGVAAVLAGEGGEGGGAELVGAAEEDIEGVGYLFWGCCAGPSLWGEGSLPYEAA